MGWCAQGGAMGGGFILFWVLFLGLIVAGLVLIVRALAPDRRAPASDGASRAVAVLEERYARGEIDRDEFAERREALTR